jgi:hypothetical protein
MLAETPPRVAKLGAAKPNPAIMAISPPQTCADVVDVCFRR